MCETEYRVLSRSAWQPPTVNKERCPRRNLTLIPEHWSATFEDLSTSGRHVKHHIGYLALEARINNLVRKSKSMIRPWN
jgi:hypothetical protein